MNLRRAVEELLFWAVVFLVLFGVSRLMNPQRATQE
jgi:hypothetical protein